MLETSWGIVNMLWYRRGKGVKSKIWAWGAVPVGVMGFVMGMAHLAAQDFLRGRAHGITGQMWEMGGGLGAGQGKGGERSFFSLHTLEAALIDKF